jgi:2-desacetyl-2-hydroxyethyl bacteriochlorophyllide A dehydrogenase
MRYRALEVTAPHSLRLAERAGPGLEPDEVLVRVCAAGICGTDLAIVDGSLSYFREGLMRYPVVPGHEWAGEVVAVGAAVERVRPGQRVTAECHIGCARCRLCRDGRYNLCPRRVRVGLVGLDGACAELVRVPERAVHCLPDHVPCAVGALVEPASVALHALERVGSLGGQRVVVLGAGPVGLLAVAFARALGAGWIAAVDLREERLAAALEMGASQAISAEAQDVSAEVGRATEGDGADVVVEATGNVEQLPRALDLAGPGGHVVVISLYKGRPMTLVADRIVARELTISGTMAGPGVWERVLRLVADGRVALHRLISHRLPLDEAPAAFDLARRPDSGALKVLIEPNPEPHPTVTPSPEGTASPGRR